MIRELIQRFGNHDLDQMKQQAVTKADRLEIHEVAIDFICRRTPPVDYKMEVMSAGLPGTDIILYYWPKDKGSPERVKACFTGRPAAPIYESIRARNGAIAVSAFRDGHWVNDLLGAHEDDLLRERHKEMVSIVGKFAPLGEDENV